MSTLTTNPLDVITLRKDFPVLDQKVNGQPLIYFDNAATSQKPVSVIQAISDFYLKDNSNVHRGIHDLSNRATTAFEQARLKVTKFINATSEEEIIFTRGTTEGINLLAEAWGRTFLKPGDTILLTQMEHHSNMVPWQIVSQHTGATLDYLTVNGDEGLLDMGELENKLSSGKVKLLAFTHISNTLGTINPAKQMCTLARHYGAVSMIDAAQSIGHCPVDVQDLDCDFLVFSGHKMCGPTGIGVLWGRKALLDSMPPYQSGGNMIDRVEYIHSTYKSAPARFEAGTPDIAGAIGLGAAVDYIEAIGRETIFTHDLELTAYALDQMRGIENIRILGPAQNHAGSICFVFPKAHASDIVTLADAHGIALRGGHHCNQALMHHFGLEATARASFYLYNTTTEVDIFVRTLKQIAKML
ncbi:MAG: cysteine desulfurase [Verrucomicrobiota bacterium]|nr:cysteine desulfurase [Verrucomicrobiota bacterium]